MRKPKKNEKAALKAYEEVVVGVQTKISSLSTAVAMMRKSVEDISQRLDSPECRNNILLVTHQILRANAQAKKMLKRASEDLEKAADELRNAVFAQTAAEPKNIFKTREVYNLIRRQFFGLKKEHEKTQEMKFALQRRIISPQRALSIAQNIFIGGEFKKLLAAVRKLKKDEQRLAKNIAEYVQREKIFHDRNWTMESRSEFLQEKYYLTRQQTLLELEKTRIDRLRPSLDNRQTELEKICQEAESQVKIELIAAGILRKNYKFVRQLEEVEARVSSYRSE